MAAENVSAGLKSGQMSVQEAQQILGVEKNATLEQARKVHCQPQRVPVVINAKQGVACTPAAADIDSLCSSCTQKFEHLFHVNEEHGSFYLQSKVGPYRSMHHS